MVILKINLLQPPGWLLQMGSEQPEQCLNIIIHPLEQISTDSLWETDLIFQFEDRQNLTTCTFEYISTSRALKGCSR